MPFLPIDNIRVDAEVASLLPHPDPDEQDRLVQDVRERGVLVELLVTRDGLLLDGHRRLEAARRAGLAEVPVKLLSLEGETNWARAVAAVVNVMRRQLGEVQRACLGSSLLRLERARAKERQIEGQRRGREHRWGLAANDEPAAPPTEARGRATEMVAGTVGISRHTLERVEALKANDPEAVRALLRGQISITRAYRRFRARQLESRGFGGRGRSDGEPERLDRLESYFGKYRTVLIDPPWSTLEPDAAAGTGPGLLDALPVRQLAHPDGCHCWIPVPWTHLRRGHVQRLLAAWSLRWVAELLWDPGQTGKGRWFHARTEVLVLASTGGIPLLRSDVSPVLAAAREAGGVKPAALYEVLESVSPGPRVELFARFARRGWDYWKGNG